MNKSLGFGPVIVLVLAVVIGTVVGLSLSRKNADLIDGVPVGTSLEPWPATVVGAQVTERGATYGLTVLTLAPGARPVTIEDVRLEGSQIRLVGVRALGPDRTGRCTSS